MHTPEMHTQQRAIRALLVCGAWLFPASAAAASAAEETPRWLRPLRDSGLLDALESRWWVATARWLADSHALQRFQEFATSSDGTLTLVGLALLCVAAALAARRLRPTGRLTLRLDFPDEIDGDFEIQLHRRSQRKARANGQRSTAPHTRKSVHRETQFDRVGPGVWFVSVEGELRARESGALLGEISDELPATIEAKQSRTIDHALDAVEAPVEFRIHWDRQPPASSGSDSPTSRRRCVMPARETSARLCRSALID